MSSNSRHSFDDSDYFTVSSHTQRHALLYLSPLNTGPGLGLAKLEIKEFKVIFEFKNRHKAWVKVVHAERLLWWSCWLNAKEKFCTTPLSWSQLTASRFMCSRWFVWLCAGGLCYVVKQVLSSAPRRLQTCNVADCGFTYGVKRTASSVTTLLTLRVKCCSDAPQWESRRHRKLTTVLKLRSNNNSADGNQTTSRESQEEDNLSLGLL